MSDVMDTTEEAIKDPPEFTKDSQARFIKGLASLDNKLVILLNTDRLLNQREIEDLKAHTVTH